MKYFTEETIEKIRQGYYSAVYFNRTQQILLQEKNLTPVTMQIFQKKDNVIVAGIEIVKELLQYATGYFENNVWIDKSDTLTIQSLKDGDVTNNWDTVMHITGPYAYFAPLESIYLGILARCSNIATNTNREMKAAQGKSVICFADRFDYFLNQELDGYSAKIGGISGVATAAQAFLWEGKPMGTIPHSLIAINNGSTIQAAESFAKTFPDVPLIVLADFDNDCVNTSLQVARHFGEKLWGVRLDTSEKLIDKSLVNQTNQGVTRTGNPATYGVNAQLVQNVRQALDREGFQFVKIVVSGGFNPEKIKHFEENNVPVDMYGVGSSLLQGNIDFTADIVKVGDKEIAKQGRKFIEICKQQ